MFFARGMVAIEVETCSGVTTARVLSAEERAGRESTGTVNLPAEAILELFQGTALERAQRRAALLPVQFAVIFGRACDEARGKAPHYRAALVLRRIGKRVVHPVAVAALAQEPAWVLERVARGDVPETPEDQIRAASQAWIDRLAERMARGE
jgi:hypothetical protein